MGFAFVPLYIKFIGIEGYGLVGFYVMLSSVLAMLDGGLGAVAVRESARFGTGGEAERREIATLLRAVEVIFWFFSCAVGLCIALCATVIVEHWLNVPEPLKQETVLAIRWMALALSLQFPTSFYSGCLVGLQKQVAINVVGVIGSTARSAGAVLVLWAVSPTVETFFIWHVVMSVVLVFVNRVLVRREFCEVATERIVWGSLKRVKNFLGGVGAINVLALLLTQIDKVILSKVLPLAEFGYYTLAWMLGTLIYRVTGPIFNTYYPKIIQLVEQKNPEQLQMTYARSWSLMSLMVIPFSIWLAFFSKDVLLLWTQSEVISQAACGALALISLGTMCNSLMHMPYALQLAHGVTRLALLQNVITLLVIGPLTWVLATEFGLTAAAIPWLLVNLSYVLITPTLMHRTISIHGMKNWYVQGIIFPLLLVVAIISLFWVFIPIYFQNKIAVVGMLFIAFITAFLVNLIFVFQVRKKI